jgi:hypothetical protein
MKKRLWLWFTLLLVVGVLAACSSGPNYKVTVTKDLYYVKDTAAPFEIKVTENGKTVKGLGVTAELSMANMDHGTTKVKLVEGKSGMYSGKVQVPMNGKYEMAFELKKGKQKTEKIIDYTVKKPKGVASINGTWITQEDFNFYKFLNQVQLAMKQESVKKQYSGENLTEELAYLKSQEKTVGDKNQIMTAIIRLRSMAMLAEEKGHKPSLTEADALMRNVKAKYNQSPAAAKLINEYGADKFWKMEREQYKLLALTKKVEQDLTAQMKKDNPKAGAQELDYLVQEKYEELLVSQVNSLKIVIL